MFHNNQIIFIDDVVKDINLHSDKNDLNENLKYLVKNILNYFKKIDYISYSYVINLLDNLSNKIAFYYIDENVNFIINKNNWISSIIYYLDTTDAEQPICYILLLYTPKKFRNKGYGSKFINSFYDNMKKKYINIKFILSATDESVDFYLKNNFDLLDKSILDYDILQKNELYDERKLYYILEKN